MKCSSGFISSSLLKIILLFITLKYYNTIQLMISDSFHIFRIIYIVLRYITSIRDGYRTEEGCLVAEYQNAVNQTFLATGNRGGRNPLFVHSASLQELTNGEGRGRGEETDEGRNQGQPWSCVEQCANSPLYPVARASTFERRSLRDPADRFPTTPPTTVTGFLSNPFFASISAFLPLPPRCRLLLLLM